MTILQKLKKYDLFDQSIIKHGLMDYIRDYEIIANLFGGFSEIKVQYIFKGCIKVNYKINLAAQSYSLDEKLLDLPRQEEPDYPQGFVWGVKFADVYSGWSLEESTDELTQLEEFYNIKLYKIIIVTNCYELSVIFNDVVIKELERLNK